MDNAKGVSGTLFFKDGKLLLVKPRKRPTYQIVGGGIEEGETSLEAAIRECHEELGDKAIFDPSKIEFVMDFMEIATSDPNLKIHMHVFIYKGLLEGELTLSDEIQDFMWFGVNDDMSIISNALKNEIIPYAKLEKLIY